MSNNISIEELTISTELLNHDQFFRRHGVIRNELFKLPRVSDATKFELPRASIFHYLPTSDVELGPGATHLFLRKATSYILVDSVVELSTVEGSPIRNAVQPTTLIDTYKRKERKIRPLKDITTAIRDDRVVIIKNYSMLSHLYRYRVTPQARLFAYNNLINTVVDNCNSLGFELAPNHQQYIQVNLPKAMPDKAKMVLGANGLTKDRLKLFPDNDSLFLLDLWKWLGPKRETSLLSKLKDTTLKLMNLIFVEKNKYVVLNLGVLNGWRKDPSDEKDKGVDAQQMQLSLLKFLDSLYAIRTVAADTIISTVDPKDEDGTESEVVFVIEDGSELEDLKKLEDDVVTQMDASIISDTPDVEIHHQFVPVQELDDHPNQPSSTSDVPHTANIKKRINDLAADGLLSRAEQQRYERLAQSYLTIPNPYGEGSLSDLATITPDDLKLTQRVITDIPTVVDKSMLNTTLGEYFNKYLGGGVLRKDVAAAVLAAQKGGVAVTDYRVEKVVDAMNRYEMHAVELTPVGGSKSTFRFKLPLPDSEGIIVSAGVKYRYRTQRSDVPIRKTKPHEVAINSYYNKTFIRRSTKVVDDYGNWLRNQVTLEISGTDNPNITNPLLGNCFDNEVVASRSFGALSQKFRRLEVGGHTVYLDLKLLKKDLKITDDDYIKLNAKYAMDGDIICGVLKDGYLVMAAEGHLYDSKSGKVFGSIEELADLDTHSSPVEHVTLNIMGKEVPMAMVLCQRYGISNLLKKLNVKHRFVVRGSRMELTEDEFAIRFKDQSLIMSRSDKVASLIFAGFSSYKNAIESYDYSSFDTSEVYGAVFTKMGLGNQYSLEIDNMFDMYIDHITEGLLANMGMPTDFGPLMLKAVEMLQTDSHPREVHGGLLRMRGYERMAGAVYKSLTAGIRQYRRKPTGSKAKVDINPFEVWNNVMGDSAWSIIEESNPMHNIKERANVTYSGTSGRSSRTMVKRHRRFDSEDIGVISADTVDNGDVGVTVFMTANPQLETLRGETKKISRKKEDLLNMTSSVLSMTSLVSPAITQDDPRRANFSSVQHSHVRAVDGYQVMPLQTGGESVVAHNVSDLFASAAKAPGRVTELTDVHIVVEYADTSIEKTVVELGRRYGVAAGTNIPHDIVTDLKVNDKVLKDQVIAWNKGFFERSRIVPTQVDWKSGVLTTVAFMESPGTFEDSCETSADLNVKMTMNTTEVREIVVSYMQEVHSLIKVGDQVEGDSILCNIEDQITAGSGMFSEQSIATLSSVSRNSPRAKCEGVVGRIEVFYNLDTDDANCTGTIKKIISSADKERAAKAKLLKRGDATTGLVSEDLEYGTVMIKIYIDGRLGSGDGDKFVFGNQMKSVAQRQMVGENISEGGKPIGAYFSWTSCDNRMVHSPALMGTAIPLIRLAGKRAVEKYRKS
jgi:hypothetical protein